MDRFVYNTFDNYFHALENTGYIKQGTVNNLLVLDFLFNLMYRDYRGYISKEDYHTLDKAINCLYGVNCLIPYPDYLKMGKLHLGEMTEVLSRTKSLEDYSEELDQRILDNDVLIADNTRRIDENESRLNRAEATIEEHESRLDNIDGEGGSIANLNNRMTTAETNINDLKGTFVIKNEGSISQTIPDIDIP